MSHNIHISPSFLSGTIDIPASKSAMQRACAAALLNIGTTKIYRPGYSNDDKTAIDIIQHLGASVIHNDDHIIVYSDGVDSIKNSSSKNIFCGESGLSMRMFAPLAAISHQSKTLVASGSLTKRPMKFINDFFPELGVKVSVIEGLAPITLTGPLTPKDITVDGSSSSQYITGLLMAYAVLCEKTCTLKVMNTTSEPYIELTLSIMQQFQMNMPIMSGLNLFTFDTYHPERRDIEYTVESDWSSAAFFLVAGAINGDITIKGLNEMSTQADASILEVLEEAGANLTFNDDGDIHIKHSDLLSFDYDATHSPDLFPPLVALACCCKGTTKIHGVHRLLNKESNRKNTLISEFKKLGALIWVEEDTMYITGGSKLSGTNVSSHNDHRIAMALAVAGLRCDGIMTIEHPEAVNKSYPDFWEHFAMLGGSVNPQ